MGNKRHFIVIDLIRGISAILIVLYHYTYRYNENEYILKSGDTFDWPIQIWWGCGAVTTFFMLSGFLTSNLFCNHTFGLKQTGKYVTNRFWRLYPTFWCAVLLTTLAMTFLMDQAVVSAKDLILNLTMLPSVLGARSVDGAYWTMQLEIFFSLIVGVALFMPRKYRVKVLLPLWIVSCIVYNCMSYNPDGICWKLFRLILMPQFAGCFVAGISAYQIIYGKRRQSYFCIVLISAVISQTVNFNTGPNTIFFFITVVLLLGSKAIDNMLSGMRNILRPLCWIASVSYPLYLTHQMVGIAILKNMRAYGFESEIIILVPITVAFITASVIHYCIEKPTAKIGKRMSLRICNEEK